MARSPRSERFGSVHAVPVEPPPSRWELPSPARMPDGAEIAGVGADLAPGTLLAAYRQGLFPMRLQARGPIGLGPLGWWSPDPRGDHPARRAARQPFVAPVAASLRDPGRHRVRRRDARVRGSEAAARLDRQEVHRRVHGSCTSSGGRTASRRGRSTTVDATRWSVVSTVSRIGGLFAAESKFHRVTDASKVARRRARRADARAAAGSLLDVQWTTPHLASLGAVDVTRARYLELVADAGRASADHHASRSRRAVASAP